MGKIRTLVFDNLTGFFELAKRAQLGDPDAGRETKGDWGLQWNKLMGQFSDVVRECYKFSIAGPENIAIIVAHIVPEYLFVGHDEKGNVVKKLLGWKADVPGSGADEVLVPFQEVYHLMALPTEAGTVPIRKLMTQKHLYNGFPIKAKSRKGIKGPIVNPSYDAIIKGLPQGADHPKQFLILGEPGVGKSTLANMFPGPRHFIDLWGGCDEQAKAADTTVSTPETLADMYQTLVKIRKTGEV